MSALSTSVALYLTYLNRKNGIYFERRNPRFERTCSHNRPHTNQVAGKG
jgi:hypothetical protein